MTILFQNKPEGQVEAVSQAAAPAGMEQGRMT